MGFDRFQVALGYYWFMSFGYADYTESCEIYDRLERIGFKPARSDEYSSAMCEPENEQARATFDRLVSEGY